MRNVPEDHAYFDYAIAEIVASINEIRGDIAARETPDALADFLDWDEHLTFSLNQFSAMYSRGYEPEQLRPVLLTAIEAGDRAAHAAAYIDRAAYQTRTDIADYRTFLWLLSLAVSMGVTDEQFAAAQRASAPVHGDRLIDSLIVWRDAEHPVSQKLLFPKSTRVLTETFIVENPVAAVARHLNSWGDVWRRDEVLIPSNSGSPNPKFYGYWAFEVLGVQTIMGLDSSLFEQYSVYPAAMPTHVPEPQLPVIWATSQANPAADLDQLAVFPIDWEVSEVVEQVEKLLRDRGLRGSFSPIEEEAYDYELMGPREDELEGHFVTIGRMNFALQPYDWVLAPVDQGGDDHAVGAMPRYRLTEFETPMDAQGFPSFETPVVQWGEGDTFTRF
ncbi:hypothetical protein JOF28_002001 [Leucobacter exalbidus]|uniref:DUF1911 domain-containing protein n=1 Tax=Leucobacter exalbidus TaxID=662960 RepID=A0A940PWS7_9MICO|nr:PoNe immunity protein domain-containing protein [Leucobacter exalbidus]MBP1326769.1 hypothetical protein [Leucobacter exalbidus]